MPEICLHLGKGLRARCTTTSFNDANGTALSALNIEVHAVPGSGNDRHDDSGGQSGRNLGAIIEDEPNVG